MASEKIEALLVSDRRFFQYPRIVLGEHEVEWKSSIKYLGVQLDLRLSFGEHLQIATAKAIQCRANLTRLMPNIGRPKEAKRRLVASVVFSKLLCAAPVWSPCSAKLCYPEETVLSAEICHAENSFSI